MVHLALVPAEVGAMGRYFSKAPVEIQVPVKAACSSSLRDICHGNKTTYTEGADDVATAF
jgi:hypothetical protein